MVVDGLKIEDMKVDRSTNSAVSVMDLENYTEGMRTLEEGIRILGYDVEGYKDPKIRCKRYEDLENYTRGYENLEICVGQYKNLE
ncbi:hypothetical protein VNO77_14388 [Canavalia gladiata]|uniref:Uncharacterized protein n=1 Tax=Canavalia gladiata TaxID=3824 RepID=A0AAN9QQS1_CANGL